MIHDIEERLSKLHGTPLRDPSQPWGPNNSHICGEATKTTGAPCRAPRNRFNDESYPCANHMKHEDRMRFDPYYAERILGKEKLEKQRALAEKNRLKEAYKTAGSDLRTGLTSSMDSAYENLMSANFTVINPKTGKFATQKGAKREMIAGAPSQTKFIVVWKGQWSSDAFTATAGDLRKFV